MGITRVGVSSQILQSPFPSGQIPNWPNNATPTAGDFLFLIVIGSPATIGSASVSIDVSGWSELTSVTVAGPVRNHKLSVWTHEHVAGDAHPTITVGSAWLNGYRWSARLFSFRGHAGEPDKIATSGVYPVLSSPVTPPSITLDREAAVVTIVSGPQWPSDLTSHSVGDFTNSVEAGTSKGTGTTDGTGGPRWAHVFHDLSQAVGPITNLPTFNSRTTEGSNGRLPLVAMVTFNLPAVPLPPTGRRGPYLGFRR